MDPDLIARLYPDDAAGGARRVIESHPRCVRPERSRPQSRSSREPTVEVPDDDSQEPYLPYIEIKFSHVPRTRAGLVFGSANTSDIVLPSQEGVSARHFALTFKDPANDGRFCLTVRDLNVTQGTTVRYGTQAGARRRQFDWIVAGRPFCNTVKPVLITLHDALSFRLVVNRQDTSSPAYRERVERFCRGSAGPGELMGALALQSGPATRPITGISTPPEDAIVIEERGSVANSSRVITRYWNVSTGEQCWSLLAPVTSYDRTAWAAWVNDMKSVSHVRSQLTQPPLPHSSLWVSYCTHTY